MDNYNDELEKIGPYIKKPESKLKKIFITIWATIFTILLYASVAYFEFGGIYHAWRKHNDAVLAIFIPPLAWYRAVEAFWHNDFAGVNWEERLKDDAKACIFFMLSSAGQVNNPHELSRGIEEFSKEISKYPKEKKEILKTSSKLFYKYQMALLDDLDYTIKHYVSNGEVHFIKIGTVLDIQSELSKYLPKEYFEQIRNSTESGYKNMEEQLLKLNGVDKTEISSRFKEMENLFNVVKSNYNSTYKKIFNDEL